MNIPVIFDFLEELGANNNRDWFNTHRDQYDKARAEFDKLLTAVISRIALFDESIRGVEAKDCTYRIYRDTRFSQDKTPYKTHFGGYINARGKKSDHCGYYLHIEPGHCLLAGGSYCLPSPVLKAIRQAIYDNMDEYRAIVENPDFKKYFPVIGESFLKTAPKGFPKDYEYLDYLKCKEYTCFNIKTSSIFLKQPLRVLKINLSVWTISIKIETYPIFKYPSEAIVSSVRSCFCLLL